MKLENAIGWTDQTTNSVTGCDKVSPGCKNCYAEAGTRARVLRSQGRETWGVKGERVPVNFEPVFRRLNKLCVCAACRESWSVNCLNTQPATPCVCGGRLRRVRLFADSNSDWLDPKWPVETLAKFLDAIRLAPNVYVQLLTKRIEKFHERLMTVTFYSEQSMTVEFWKWVSGWQSGKAPSNVWLGVSVEDQKRADERIPLLLKTPAAIRFLSVEPLLEKMSLTIGHDYKKHDTLKGTETYYNSDGASKVSVTPKIDWIIVGGESGKNRRDCGAETIESVALQCANAGVPCYVKQDSALLPGKKGRLSDNAWSFKEFPR